MCDIYRAKNEQIVRIASRRKEKTDIELERARELARCSSAPFCAITVTFVVLRVLANHVRVFSFFLSLSISVSIIIISRRTRLSNWRNPRSGVLSGTLLRIAGGQRSRRGLRSGLFPRFRWLTLDLFAASRVGTTFAATCGCFRRL